ncbi:hypothetical protein [Rufibacter sp. LB8]|uniref:hypothetical protein n=1 Tax=Rufibacter sp. LB8 TaxID=2777781 RepID=UPI00178C2873|nr:hypothetical protein [Rufibacter sp. LB8]
MLHTFTWTQYCLTVGTALFLYYLVFLYRFYRSRLRERLARVKSSLQGRTSLAATQPPSGQEGEVMGPAAPAPGVSYSTSAQLRFAFPGQMPQQDQLLTQVPEILQEFRSIGEVLDKEAGTREDLPFLLQAVKLRYPEITDSPHLPALLANLREQLPFEVSAQELEILWQTTA